MKNLKLMLDESIRQLEADFLPRIESAGTPEALEAVRVAAFGRKEGAFQQIAKDLGKLAPDDRKRIGMLLNAAKQKVEEALEAKKQQFDQVALAARLDTEWVDLILPAQGPRRGHLHPITQIQRELEDLFVSLGFAVLDGPAASRLIGTRDSSPGWRAATGPMRRTISPFIRASCSNILM